MIGAGISPPRGQVSGAYLVWNLREAAVRGSGRLRPGNSWRPGTVSLMRPACPRLRQVVSPVMEEVYAASSGVSRTERTLTAY